jgi:hypothetical protein
VGAAFGDVADAFTGAGAGAAAAAACTGLAARGAAAAVFAFTGCAADCSAGAAVSAAGCELVCVSAAGAVVVVESVAGGAELVAGAVVSGVGGTLCAMRLVDVMARTAPSAVRPGRTWICFWVIMKFNSERARRWRHLR